MFDILMSPNYVWFLKQTDRIRRDKNKKFFDIFLVYEQLHLKMNIFFLNSYTNRRINTLEMLYIKYYIFSIDFLTKNVQGGPEVSRWDKSFKTF